MNDDTGLPDFNDAEPDDYYFPPDESPFMDEPQAEPAPARAAPPQPAGQARGMGASAPRSLPEADWRRDGEDAVAAFIRLTREHAYAAVSESPEQPWLLMGRRSAAAAIEAQGPEAKMRLGIASADHLDVLDADVSDSARAPISLQERDHLAFGIRPELDAAERAKAFAALDADAKSAMVGGPEYYPMLKRRQASLSEFDMRDGSIEDVFDRGRVLEGSGRHDPARHFAAAKIDTLARQAAANAVEGQIVEIAMRDRRMALRCLADAGLPREACTMEALEAKLGMVESYLVAERFAREAAKANDMERLSRAEEDRLRAMKAIHKDPVALAALGVAAAEAGIDIRGKYLSDLALIKAAENDRERGEFDKELERFKPNFIKDATGQEPRPVDKWISLQDEIRKQEVAGGAGKNLAFLRKLSEKTALEASKQTQSYKYVATVRPDLAKRFVDEANKRREGALTLAKEPTAQVGPDGRVAINEAAGLRNAGMSDKEAAKAAPSAAAVDPKTAAIRQEQAAVRTEAPKQAPVLRATPEDRIGAQPAPKQAQTTRDRDRTPSTESGPSLAAGDWRKPIRLSADSKSETHRNKHRAEFDHDDGPFTRKKAESGDPMDRENDIPFAQYVNSRVPTSQSRLVGQLTDRRKLVFALPLNSFGDERNRDIKKLLNNIALEDPERLMKMYFATKDTMKEWGDRKSESDRQALDKLELGRRVMAEVAVKHGLLPLDKAVAHAQKMRSEDGRKLPARYRHEPQDFVEKGDMKKYAAYLGRMSAGKAVEVAHRTAAAGYKKGMENAKKKGIEAVKGGIKKAISTFNDTISDFTRH